MGIRRLTWLLGDTSDLIQATLDDLGVDDEKRNTGD